MTFSVYISHSTSPWELAQVYVLAQEMARQGLDPVIPHRGWDPHQEVPPNLSESLERAQAVLVFATLHGHHVEWVSRELLAAERRRLGRLRHPKPILALVERGIELQGIPPQNVVVFDRTEDLTVPIQTITTHIQSFELQKEDVNLLTGLLIGGVILLVLRGLGGKGSQE